MPARAAAARRSASPDFPARSASEIQSVLIVGGVPVERSAASARSSRACPEFGLSLREIAVAPCRPDLGWHFVQGLAGQSVIGRVTGGRGIVGGKRGIGHAGECGWPRAPSQLSSAGGALQARPVCTRVRLDDACGDADEESDTVQQPSPPSLTMPTLDSSFAGPGALGATTWTCLSAGLDAGTAPRTGPTGRDARRTPLDGARMGCAAQRVAASSSRRELDQSGCAWMRRRMRRGV